MTVKTDRGNFNNFYSVWRFMQEEHLESIKILGVDFWAGSATVSVGGTYTLDEIYQIFTDEPKL